MDFKELEVHLCIISYSQANTKDFAYIWRLGKEKDSPRFHLSIEAYIWQAHNISGCVRIQNWAMYFTLFYTPFPRKVNKHTEPSLHL